MGGWLKSCERGATNGTFSPGGDAHHELAQRRTGPADEEATHAHTIVRVAAAVRVRALGRVHAFSLRVDNVTNALHNALHREARAGPRISLLQPAANSALGYRVQL